MTKKFMPKVYSFCLELDTVWSDGSGDEYTAQLIGDRYFNSCLEVGCRSFFSRKQAEAHWKGGVSKESGKKRPHAAALIEWAAAEFKRHGFKW